MCTCSPEKQHGEGGTPHYPASAREGSRCPAQRVVGALDEEPRKMNNREFASEFGMSEAPTPLSLETISASKIFVFGTDGALCNLRITASHPAMFETECGEHRGRKVTSTTSIAMPREAVAS